MANSYINSKKIMHFHFGYIIVKAYYMQQQKNNHLIADFLKCFLNPTLKCYKVVSVKAKYVCY